MEEALLSGRSAYRAEASPLHSPDGGTGGDHPTLLPLDDCFYALQATIPHLTRSSLHRCLERHGISRLPEVEGCNKPGRKKFERYPIGYFHVDLAEVRTAEGKLYLFVAIDRTSKFAFVELVERADMRMVARCRAYSRSAIRAFMNRFR